MKIHVHAAALLLLTCLTSCEERNTESKTVGQWQSSRETSAGTYIVELDPVEVNSITRNKHFSLKLSLKQKGSGPTTPPEKIVIDADMPAHKHGMNTKPELTKIAPNQYRVDGMLFHMSGDWVITVKINPGTGQWEKADFPVTIE